MAKAETSNQDKSNPVDKKSAPVKKGSIMIDVECIDIEPYSGKQGRATFQLDPKLVSTKTIAFNIRDIEKAGFSKKKKYSLEIKERR